VSTSIPPPSGPSKPALADGEPPRRLSSDGPIADRRWGPRRVAGGVAALLAIVVVEAAIVGAFDPDLSSLGAKLVLQAMLALTLVAVAFRAAEPEGTADPAVLGLHRPLLPAVRLTVKAYAAYFAFALVYAALLQPHQKDLTRDLGFGHGAIGAVAAGVLIIVAAPISEEIFFRGFMFGGLRKRLSFAWAALISAVIFGAFHYTGVNSLGVIPQLAILGLVQAWLYERSGSIYPTIALHMFNNAIAFAILTQ
jgi:membrane protease YdiL (CAAX protease family)